MTDVLIKRELLERLACEVIPKTHQEMLDASEDFGAAIKELRAILAAPRQPEGELEVVGLLREVRVIVAREVERWTRASEILPVTARVESGLLTRIDAALAEVEG